MVNKKQKIAHIDAKGQEQTLREHLEGTAERAGAFAAEFGCGQAAKLCGLLHDIGKNSREFQERVRNPLPSNRMDHSTAGAKEIQKMNKDFLPLGMAIAGHHSGLMDGGNFRACTSGDGTYFGRMKSNIPDYHMQEVMESLGGKYLESGAYIEVFFPQHHVRYIAVNDGVDPEQSGGLDITPFKNILNVTQR